MTNGVTNFAGIVPTLPLPLPPSLFPTPLPPHTPPAFLFALTSLVPHQSQAVQALSQVQEQQQQQLEQPSQLAATSASELPTPLPHELLLCSESHALSLTSSLPPSHPLARMPALARVYAKKLSASDTAVHGSLSLPRKVALNCLPSLVSE